MFGTYTIFLVIVLTVSFSMGLFVLLKNTRSKINRNFFYLSFSIVVWILSSYLEDVIKQPSILNILLKIDYASGAAVFFYFFIFPGELVELEILKKKLVKVLLYFLLIAQILIIFFTNYIISGYEYIDGVLNPVLGNEIFVYYIFLGIFSSIGIVIAAIKYKKAEGDKKAQILYTFIGMFIALIIGIATNIVLVDYIKSSPNYLFYTRLGIYGTIFVNIFGGYAIIKHRLLNVKIITTELLALAVVIVSLVQLFTVENLSNFITQSIIFIVLSFFAYRLVVSVEKEIERKEELQKMSDSLAQANDQLRKLDNAKTEFISIASHQLRTPVTAIKGFASLLMEGSYGEVSKDVRGALEKIYVSSERLVNLIEDLLNVSRIESGRLTFTFENAHIEKTLKELYDNFLLIAKTKKFYFDLKLPKEPLPEFKMDASKIRELISNFIDNALKYTEKGGVTVSAEIKENGAVIDEQGFVKVGEKAPFGKVVRITVSDTGIGIPKEEIPYLFKKFSRGKDVSRLHVGGTGLGLYVGKAIADAHHGATWVESDGAGMGSRFIIEIPINAE